ncbi:presenilins-associated rhomboid-like protein, mitochondrial isoform X2 [Daktulosphaira vitifoliae]|uniref:presenilins-associated rhomboid-like protein, mitochondrial isoform X2 n=1 Tax=Daktulosphaira vitifoliae TaxID=58002 RepID=UPI0021AA4C4C|nr:presenilins-associated rhomboid-like protein, mitochondrial isoform X2 [Daktulosphaira vitifoliae]
MSHRSLSRLHKLSNSRSSLINPHYYRRRAYNSSESLFYPTVFTLSVSTGAIVVASICEYERFSSTAKKLSNSIFDEFFVQNAERNNQNIFSQIKKLWYDLPASRKVFAVIVSINALVFFAWKIPRYESVMIKYFMTDALAKKIPVSSLLLSAFSHSSPLHLLFNMVALNSFCAGVIHPWGSMSPEEFSAMYLSACVVSSLTSILFRRSFGLVGNSLGASGAILTVVSYFAVTHPNEQLSIIFLPGIHFDAIVGLGGLMCLDTMGLILRWQMFDHAAHLGGAAYGIFWHNYISKYVWGNRKYIVGKWIIAKTFTKKLFGQQR